MVAIFKFAKFMLFICSALLNICGKGEDNEEFTDLSYSYPDSDHVELKLAMSAGEIVIHACQPCTLPSCSSSIRSSEGEKRAGKFPSICVCVVRVIAE